MRRGFASCTRRHEHASEIPARCRCGRNIHRFRARRSRRRREALQGLLGARDPRRAIREGLELLSRDVGLTPAEVVSQADLCINGTTVGLNALIQLKGARGRPAVHPGARGLAGNPARSQGGRPSLRCPVSAGADVGAALSALSDRRAGPVEWYGSHPDERSQRARCHRTLQARRRAGGGRLLPLVGSERSTSSVPRSW